MGTILGWGKDGGIVVSGASACQGEFRAARKAAIAASREVTAIDVIQSGTHLPARFMAAEIIREQILLDTKEEIPYAVTVVIEQFEEGERMTRIAALIYCEREGQKAILVGRGGQMLKKVGTAARLAIERMLGTKVFLELFVKVRPGWRQSREFVEGLDWRRQVENLAGPEKVVLKE